jgi:hypothetical protein
MSNFLGRLFNRRATESEPAAAADLNQDTGAGAATNAPIVSVDLDQISPTAKTSITEAIIEQNKLPLYVGEVRHGYALEAVPAATECPRCHAPTQRYCANFIYATNIAPRVILAPAGYFCTACPTVIVDVAMIASGVKQGFQFREILGIDYDRQKDPDLFKTWNGKEAIFIFDEDQKMMGMSTMDDSREGRASNLPAMAMDEHGGFTTAVLAPLSGPTAAQRKNKKHKRDLAKRARQRNRKHRQ